MGDLASAGGSRNVDEKPGDALLREVTLAVVGALAAGIGSVGFVVAVGGIVTQARFRGAGLPAEQSVAVEPRSVLLAVGGEVLAAAVLAGLAAIALVYWWPELHGAPTAAAQSGSPAAATQDTTSSPTPAPVAPGPVPILRRPFGWWCFVVLVAAIVADYWLLWAAGELDSITQRELLLLVWVIAVLGAGIITMLGNNASQRAPAGHGGQALRLAALFAVTVVVGGMMAVAGSLAAPKVRPAAALVGPRPEILRGLYVGQTADRLYLGTAHRRRDNPDLGDHQRGSIVEVARSRVQELIIGTSQQLRSAMRRQCVLARGSLQAETPHTRIVPACRKQTDARAVPVCRKRGPHARVVPACHKRTRHEAGTLRWERDPLLWFFSVGCILLAVGLAPGEPKHPRLRQAATARPAAACAGGLLAAAGAVLTLADVYPSWLVEVAALATAACAGTALLLTRPPWKGDATSNTLANA